MVSSGIFVSSCIINGGGVVVNRCGGVGMWQHVKLTGVGEGGCGSTLNFTEHKTRLYAPYHTDRIKNSFLAE